MRITNDMSQRMTVQYLLDDSHAMYDLQDQISSGKKVRRPSDDPQVFGQIARLGADEARLAQYQSNTQVVSQQTTTYDGILQQIADQLQRVSELTVKGADGSLTPADRQTMGREVDLMLEDVVNLANTHPGGSYLFGGLRTDTPAYTVTRDAAGQITGVTYQGNAGVRQAEIATGMYVPANLVGSDLSGESALFQTASVDLFANLINLRDQLQSGRNLAEPAVFTADAGTDVLTVGTAYATGSAVTLESDGTLPAGLAAGQTYYAIRVSDTEIRLANSPAAARAGTCIDITDAGTGSHGIVAQCAADNERTLNHVLTVLSSQGASAEHLSAHATLLQNLTAAAKGARDSVEAVDTAQAYTELTAKQAAYEASLRVTSLLANDSLVKYL